MQFINGIFSMFLVVFLFTKIRGFIFKRAKGDLAKGYQAMRKESAKIAKETLPAQITALNLTKIQKLSKKINTPIITAIQGMDLNCSIGKSYKKGKESFSWTKFKKIFDLGDGIEWIKSIKEMIDLRKLTIYLLILSCFFAYGWYKGRLETPVKIIGANELVGTFIPTDGGFVTFKANGEIHIVDKDKKTILKKITAGDMPGFRKALKPIGFILEPIFIAGGSTGGGKSKGEIGAGISFLKVWKWQIEAFFSSYPAVYLGTSYSITKNSGAGVGVGKGVDGSNRATLYYKWRF